MKLTGVEPTEKCLRSQGLKWFGHNKRMTNEKATPMAVTISVKGKKKDLINVIHMDGSS